MFKLALVEYQHALYTVAVAQYRQAHVSLRLFFELSLCCILFSAREIDAHLWLKGRKDSNWAAITSKDDGVFSKHFVGAFFEEMKEHCEEYQALAVSLYRDCSEFVHGNRQTFDGLDTAISFKPKLLDNWIDRADTAQRVIKFAFLCRYLRHLDRIEANKFEQMALESFGDLAAMQALFDEQLK